MSNDKSKKEEVSLGNSMREVGAYWAYPAPPVYALEGENVNILDYWRVLLKRKWLILFIFFLVMGGIFVWTLNSPKKYTSKVTLMPMSSSGGGGFAAMAAQISSLPLIGGQMGDMTEKLGGGKSKELVNILKSRNLSERIITRFNLMPVLFKGRYGPQAASLPEEKKPILQDGIVNFQKKIVKVEADKATGLIELQVTLENPELAAHVANGMIIELQDFIQNNSLTLAKRNRIFIEEQLVKNRVELLKAGKALNQFFSNDRISSVVPELDVEVGKYEGLPKTFEEFREQFGSLSGRQEAVEKMVKSETVKGVPGRVYLEYLTLNRELLEKIHMMLTQQYEMAKIEEAKEDLGFQVLDRAEVMVRPSSPRMILNMLIAVVLGSFLAVFFAFFVEYLHKLRQQERISRSS